MFYLVPYGRSLLSSIAKFEDRALACGFAESAHKGNGDHYNVVEFKTVWTTKTLEQLTSVEGKAADLRSPESVIVQTPVEQKNAVETLPVAIATVKETPVATALVRATRSKSRTFKKCLSTFDGPMPTVLRSLSSTISLNKAASVLGIPDGVIKRLAKEGKIKIYNNGLNGHDRRYFIPAADLRRLYKK
jgi:hypothetical protein